MLCDLVFSFALIFSCGDKPAPEPTPTSTPTVQERQRTSTDGKSLWEWKYEQMCGCTFEREPLSDEEIAARDAAEEAEDDGGRFIFIPDR